MSRRRRLRGSGWVRGSGLGTTRAITSAAVMLSVLAWPSRSWAAPPTVELEDYVVQKGDTCYRIAKRRFGDGKRYDLIHKYNRSMGPTPHRLVEGEVLRLPVAIPDETAKSDANPDAELTHAHRKVQARAAEVTNWAEAEVGLDLYRGWRVNTLQRASAEVTFRDTSRLEMRQNTLVIIYGATRSRSRSQRLQAELASGALRARLGELAGETKVEVETPSATATVEGGDALVTVDEAETSRLANHGEGETTLRARGREVRVGPKMGSKAKKGEAPTPAQPLPPAPTWEAGPPAQVIGLPGIVGQVRGRWNAVAEAESYLVQLGRAPEGGELLSTVTVDAKVRSFELRGLPPGVYYLRVSSIDADGFESPPGPPARVELVGAELAAADGVPVSAAVDGEEEENESFAETGGAAVSDVRVLPGATLTLPSPIRCTLGSSGVSSTLRFDEVGTVEPYCEDPSGRPVGSFVVQVQRPQMLDASGAPLASVELFRGRTESFEFELRGEGGTVPAIELEAPAGVSLVDSTYLGKGRWRVQLRAEADAPERGDLAVYWADGPRSQPVTSLELRTPAPASASASDAAPTPIGWTRFELGALLGMRFPPRDLQLVEAGLFDAIEERPELRRVGAVLGARFAYLPIPYLALEGDIDFTPARTKDGRGALLLGLRGQVSAQLKQQVSPVVSVGGGTVGVLSRPTVLGTDFDGAFHFGGGLRAAVSPSMGVRLEFRDTLMPDLQGKVAHLVDVYASLYWRFGPRGLLRGEAKRQSSTPPPSDAANPSPATGAPASPNPTSSP